MKVQKAQKHSYSDCFTTFIIRQILQKNRTNRRRIFHLKEIKDQRQENKTHQIRYTFYQKRNIHTNNRQQTCKSAVLIKNIPNSHEGNQ